MKDARDYINEIKEDMRFNIQNHFGDEIDELPTLKRLDINIEIHDLRERLLEFLQEDEFTYIDSYCIYYHDCFEIVNNLRTFTSFEDCPIGLEITNIQQLAFSMLHAELMNDGTIYDVVDEILEEAKEKREEAMSC